MESGSPVRDEPGGRPSLDARELFIAIHGEAIRGAIRPESDGAHQTKRLARGKFTFWICRSVCGRVGGEEPVGRPPDSHHFAGRGGLCTQLAIGGTDGEDQFPLAKERCVGGP